MAQLLEMADASSEGRVMVLGGTQDGFSSGNDVSTFTSVPLAARLRSAHGDRKSRICMLYARAAV
jgi:enoyl-CoA hydratase/carnithine racemase